MVTPQLEMSVIASQLGMAQISDVAFLKRFAKCRDWLSWMVCQMVPKPIIEYETLSQFSDYQVVAVDASHVSEKGRSGRIFRLHDAMDVFVLRMCSVSCQITEQQVGESLTHFKMEENGLVLADRIDGTLTGIEHGLTSGANFVLRLRGTTPSNFTTNKASRFNSWIILRT